MAHFVRTLSGVIENMIEEGSQPNNVIVGLLQRQRNMSDVTAFAKDLDNVCV
jgi:hypothetical protein